MFSIIMPMDVNRLEQFAKTKRSYDLMPQVKEFIIPSRSTEAVTTYLREHELDKDVWVVPYEHELGFNPSKALNVGVRASRYDSIIITSPEVLPKTDVLAQLEPLVGKNVVCEVWDEDETGKIPTILVNSQFRSDSPAMYFLAMYNKADIEKINGWDEDFMLGYAYEDNDFGERWKRAGLPYEFHDEIEAIHQYHPRGETIVNGASLNEAKLNDNNTRGITWCENGLISGKM